MKIWYQSFTRRDHLNRYSASLDALVHATVPAGVEVRVAGVPRDAGHANHQFRYFEMVDARDVVSNAIRAQDEGYSAFLIGNIADPAIECAREVTDIPVIGLCGTSISVASQMGQSFGFVTINEQQEYRLKQNVRDYGAIDRYVGGETLNVSYYPSIDDSYDSAGVDSFVEKFSERVERLSDRGAEVVIPAGGVVMALLAKAGLTKVGDIPIVDGIQALVALGCVYGSMFEARGHFTSKRLAYAGPPPDAMAEIRELRGGHLMEGPLGVAERTNRLAT